MNSLHIEVTATDFAQSAATGTTERIAVSHMRARQLALHKEHQELPINPGLLLVLPQEISITMLAGGQSLQVPPGTAALFNGRTLKTLLSTDSAEDSETTVGSVNLIELNALINDTFSLHERIQLPCILDAATSEQLLEAHAILSGRLAPPPLSHGRSGISGATAAALLVEIILASAAPSSVGDHPSMQDQQLTRLKQFMQANLSSRITNEDMAAHLGMSLSVFGRWAKRALSDTPAHHVRRLRLEAAQQLIAQGNSNIAEVAEQAGFSDRYHLDREFTRHFLISPAKYRLACKLEPQIDVSARASEQFSRGQFQQSLRTCNEAIPEAATPAIRNRLRFQRGLCLSALGRNQDAICEWEKLQKTELSHDAGVQACRAAFRAGSPEQALDVLQRRYAEANERQARDLIHTWIDQAGALMAAKAPRPLRQYLAARKALFPHDRQSTYTAVNALRMLGDNLEILEQCADLTIGCYNALRRAGLYDEAVERYGTQLPAESIILGALTQGRYEEALAMKPKDPRYLADILVALGRAEEAIETYPEHSATAYLALERYEELLERFPPGHDHNSPRVAALLSLGRTEEIDALQGDPAQSWHWLNAQLFIRPTSVLKSSLAEARRFAGRARVLMAIEALMAGDKAKAETTLEQVAGIRDPDLWWEDHTSAELLTAALLRGILSAADQLQADLAEIVANHRYQDKQILWHNAAYLTGRITEAEFRCQPQQKEIPERFHFIQAIAEDLAGHPTPARAGYEAVLQTAYPLTDADLMRHRFAQWRLQELANTPRGRSNVRR